MEKRKSQNNEDEMIKHNIKEMDSQILEKESVPNIQERVNGNVPLSHDMLLSAPDIHSPNKSGTNPEREGKVVSNPQEQHLVNCSDSSETSVPSDIHRPRPDSRIGDADVSKETSLPNGGSTPSEAIDIHNNLPLNREVYSQNILARIGYRFCTQCGSPISENCGCIAFTKKEVLRIIEETKNDVLDAVEQEIDKERAEVQKLHRVVYATGEVAAIALSLDKIKKKLATWREELK